MVHGIFTMVEWQTDSKLYMIYIERRYSRRPWTTLIRFQGHARFDAEYLRNGNTNKIGTYTRTT